MKFAFPLFLALPFILHGALPSSVSLTSSPNPAFFGRPVTLTAVVAPITATGSVTFYDGATVLETEPLAANAATFTTALLPFGARSLKARYNGDAGHAASTSAALVETVNTVAGTGFQEFRYQQSSELDSVVVGDFNGDGNQDLVLTSASVGVEVMLGNGDGTFQAPTSYALSTAGWLAVGDFNGDGKPDLAAAGQTGIFILFGNGDGTFQPALQRSTLYAGNVVVGDFNGDGRADLAFFSLSSGAYGVDVLLGNGDGTFGQPSSFPLTNNPAYLSLGDFNGDGIADLAYSLFGIDTGSVGVLLGNGDGTFRAGGSNTLFSSEYLAVGDFNGDGKLDIADSIGGDLIGGGPNTSVWLNLGNGDGTFRPPVPYSVTLSAVGITVGDFNGDGKADLVAATTGDTAFLFGNGDGTFEPAVPGPPGPGTIAVGDFNGDGRADVVGTDLNGKGFEVLLALGPPTTTTLSPSPNPSTYTQDVTLTATVTPRTATGTATFYDGSTPLGTGTLNAGTASLSVSTFSVGAHSLTATYNGDSNEGSSTSPVVTQTVNVRPTSTTLTSSPNPSAPGQSVTVTVTVSPSSATGAITLYDGSTVLGTAALSGGAATLPINTLSVGAHLLTAAYGGDTNDGSSVSSIVTQTVFALTTSTSLTAAPNPSSFGQSVSMTATVSPSTATGNVTFYAGAAPLGVIPPSGGLATLGVTTLPAGSNALTATYGGDASHLASTSTVLAQMVNKATTTTTLVSAPDPSTFLQSVTLTATVAPAGASGTVTFRHGSTVVGSADLSSGKVSIATSSLPVGNKALTASYAGDANNSSSTSKVRYQDVRTTTSTALTSTPNPSSLNQIVTLTAAVTPATATGTVTFYHGSTAMGTGTLSAGKATLATSTLTSGGHSLTATYTGDTGDAPSASSVLTQYVK